MLHLPNVDLAVSSTASLSSSTEVSSATLRQFDLPFLVFTNIAGPLGGRAFLFLLILARLLCCCMVLAATTRLVFAMARDGALPLSLWLYRLHPRLLTPQRATVLVVICVVCIPLFVLSSSQTLHAIVGVTSSCAQVCLGIIASPLRVVALCRTKVTNSRPPEQLAYAAPLLFRLCAASGTYRRGPFHLGRFSRPVGWIAVAWLLATSSLPLWPRSGPVSAENMNYSVVVFACLCKSLKGEEC